MTLKKARAAMSARDKVEAGRGDDHDTGYIVEIIDDDTALVAWDSGTRTPCPLRHIGIA